LLTVREIGPEITRISDLTICGSQKRTRAPTIIDLMWHGRVIGPDTPHLKFLRIKEMARLLILLVSFGFYA
jgi:hypothetical protein